MNLMQIWEDMFKQKGKFSHYLLTLMLMDSWEKFHNSQNISEASRQHGVAAFF